MVSPSSCTYPVSYTHLDDNRAAHFFLFQFLSEYQQPEKKEVRRTVIIKDVRLFMNTIQKAVDTMRLSGIPAVTAQNETEEYIECVVRIPKSSATRRRVG